MSQASPPTVSIQQTPGVWDGVAPTYAEDVAQWGAFVEESLRLVPAVSGQRVLDVACGPGTLALRAAKSAGRVDAIDFSQGMIQELTKRAEREGLDNVEAGVMDAQSLTFADASFDNAYCLFGFFFFPDRARAFREIFRTLKPGGRLLVATWGPIERRPLMKVGFDAMAEAAPQLPRPAKGDLQSPEECVREMREGGFADVTAHVFTPSVHVPGPKAYCDMIVRSGAPFAAMRKKIGDEAFRALTDKLTAAVAQRIPEGGADLAAESILTIGSKPG